MPFLQQKHFQGEHTSTQIFSTENNICHKIITSVCYTSDQSTPCATGKFVVRVCVCVCVCVCVFLFQNERESRECNGNNASETALVWIVLHSGEYWKELSCGFVTFDPFLQLFFCEMVSVERGSQPKLCFPRKFKWSTCTAQMVTLNEQFIFKTEKGLVLVKHWSFMVVVFTWNTKSICSKFQSSRQSIQNLSFSCTAHQRTHLKSLPGNTRVIQKKKKKRRKKSSSTAWVWRTHWNVCSLLFGKKIDLSHSWKHTFHNGRKQMSERYAH